MFFFLQIYFLHSILRRPHTDRIPDDVPKKLQRNRNRVSCEKKHHRSWANKNPEGSCRNYQPGRVRCGGHHLSSYVYISDTQYKGWARFRFWIWFHWYHWWMPKDELARRGQIDKLPATFIEKKVLRPFYFTLRKLIAKLSSLQLQPFTMASSDYHSSIPHCYLPCPPQTETIANIRSSTMSLTALLFW